MKKLRPRKTKKVKVKFEYIPVGMTYKPTLRCFIMGVPIFI